MRRCDETQAHNRLASILRQPVAAGAGGSERAPAHTANPPASGASIAAPLPAKSMPRLLRPSESRRPSARRRWICPSMSASSDRDEALAQFSWDFGDGAQADGALVGHTYNAPGIYGHTVWTTSTARPSASSRFSKRARRRTLSAAGSSSPPAPSTPTRTTRASRAPATATSPAHSSRARPPSAATSAPPAAGAIRRTLHWRGSH